MNVIPAELYNPLIWGKNGKYLDCSGNNLRLSHKNQTPQTIHAMEIFFHQHGEQIHKELSQKSDKELRHFVRNMSYLFAKLNTNLSHRIKPMRVPSYFAKLAASALLSELVST